MLRQVTRQLCEALNWIFTQHNILHRDIKPGNILVRDYDLSTETIQVALADFGLSKSIDLLTTHGSRPGTLLFMAPELIHSKHSNQEIAPFSVHSDMFALGVTLFQLMTCNTTLALAQFCMEGEDMKKFLKKKLIQVESLKDATTTSYSEEFIDIVARMLMLDPNERITLREVLT
ncbi:hypothetical protein C9374_011859 [Naegleria lovaniensis]|uniref:Protein kinase domain-containing protein n=1 Tax=Naegleria lovaniensis TaxID=51637 RepID=A0AA88G919_NAELO|nr:uncharacterized protein C9374_011859 [Naegleria lovaniensis]KAG2373770.1 hypothetical protein C9374_011859 [Naegleria lovaniensis]